MSDALSSTADAVTGPPIRPQDTPSIEDLAEDMARRWRKGERPPVEEYLALHPELGDQPEAALELVYEEIQLRQEDGPEVLSEELFGRFPQWRRQVQALLDCHHLLAPRLAGPRYPQVGEMMGEFRLLAELGRGGQGRVYLATQPTLADRLVVLKLGPRAGREHLSLARLQHTHIVPLHSVHDSPAHRFRALCMPYFGGATLAQLLAKLRARPLMERTGRDLLDALRQIGAASRPEVKIGGPACTFLARASYIQAVCWIGACLADALHYAHERGLLHLDLKPSNVLLAADGQPMLLDFHLAHPPISASQPAPLWLGGTPGYMAPEQEAALEAVQEQRRIPLAVDGRADLFALGLLLYEMLGGRLPGPGEAPARSLRKLNPRVTVGLADLVARCLAPSAEMRYPAAAALAADLRRHLADLPLHGVPNRSLAERWAKWRRRRRQTLPLLMVLFTAFIATGLAVGYFRGQTHKARAALQEGTDYLDRRQYAEALDAWKRGVALAEDLPLGGELTRQLQDRLRVAERAQAAHELHLFCEQARPLYIAAPLPESQARAVARHCRTFWQQREEILQRLRSPGGSALDRQVRADLFDVAILAANLRVRLAPPEEVAAARMEALEILDQAEALLGPSCVLCRERQVQARALGRTRVAKAAERQAAGLSPQSAWEHSALGLVAFRAGDMQEAAEQLDRALELEPGALWPNFYRGSCAYKLRQYEDAAAFFSICVALAPRCAWCYYNRGQAYTELSHPDRALHDFDRALHLDPTLAEGAATAAPPKINGKAAPAFRLLLR
jgi:serine/threonine protein kinase/tetratricopeptide (TPR) repeat protein